MNIETYIRKWVIRLRSKEIYGIKTKTLYLSILYSMERVNRVVKGRRYVGFINHLGFTYMSSLC